MTTSRAAFHWDDPLLLDAQLSDDERMVRDAARAYCQHAGRRDPGPRSNVPFSAQTLARRPSRLTLLMKKCA